MVTIIDYGTGNLRSITNALDRLGATYTLTADPAAIRSAERVLLPGVGEAATAMQQLRDNLFDFILDTASGKQTKAEQMDFHEIAVWKDGVTE